MRGECNTYGGEERHIQGFSGEIREGDNLENSGIDGRIILKWIFKEWCGGLGGGMDWIDVARDRDRRQAVVNAVMNVQVL